MLTGGSTSVLYGWGHNHRGQLGGIEGTKVKNPRALEAIAGLKPLQIACGEQCVFIVTHNGKVEKMSLILYKLILLGYRRSIRLATERTDDSA